ncbi:MAG: hypothetical protein AAFR14_09690, partial [Bacteroidota bacterium]
MGEGQYRSRQFADFRSSRTAIGCILLLSLATLLSLLAYVIIPDGTPNANRQIPRLALLSPTSIEQFVMRGQSYEVEKVSLISRMLSGQRDDVIFIPVDDIRSTQGQLEISHEGVISYQDMAEL